MGQAFDRDGNVLGEAEADTRSEVLEKLERQHPDADEIRIRQKIAELEAKLTPHSDTPATE